MRIHDEKNDKTIKFVTLFLTLGEANEIVGKLNHLIKDWPNKANEHVHITDHDDMSREITIAIYSPLDDFKKYLHPRAIEIIEKNK